MNGKPYYLAYADEQHTRLLSADHEAAVLYEYDDYYYSKNREKRLPVLRVKMAMEDEPWYYVDPATAQVVLKHQDLSRLERWLYHGLHSFDFRFLVYRRPLWDIVVIVLMIGGTLVSATGLVLTWKWLSRKVRV